MKQLNEYAWNVYSQRGEDGIIARLIELLHSTPQWCVEFGAWDGKHLSNTHALIQAGWSGVFIEGNPTRFKSLQQTYAKNPKTYNICTYVGFQSPSDLDSILAKTPIPKDFGVLSIDIDGNDYHVWEAVREYHPSIIVIEYNPTIPPTIDFVQPKNPRINQGNSLKALVRLGIEKGYELVATTSLNAFFVRKDLFQLVKITDNSIEKLFSHRSGLMEVFQLYDGTLVFTGERKLFWHSIPLNHFQPIPRIFRIFPYNMGKVRLLLFKVWRKLIGFF